MRSPPRPCPTRTLRTPLSPPKRWASRSSAGAWLSGGRSGTASPQRRTSTSPQAPSARTSTQFWPYTPSPTRSWSSSPATTIPSDQLPKCSSSLRRTSRTGYRSEASGALPATRCWPSHKRRARLQRPPQRQAPHPRRLPQPPPLHGNTDSHTYPHTRPHSLHAPRHPTSRHQARHLPPPTHPNNPTPHPRHAPPPLPRHPSLPHTHHPHPRPPLLFFLMIRRPPRSPLARQRRLRLLPP